MRRKPLEPVAALPPRRVLTVADWKLPPPTDNAIEVVIGIRGSGKSTFLKRSMAAWPLSTRVLCFDPHNEFSRRGRPAKAVELGPLHDVVTTDQLVAQPGLLKAKHLSLAVTSRDVEEDTIVRDFRAVSSLALAAQDLVLVVSELAILRMRALKQLNFLATQSRHVGVSLVGDAQFAVAIPPYWRRQVTTFVCFRQDVEEDLDDLEFRFKQDTSRIGQLEKFHFLTWHGQEQKGLTP
jgi:hypothetical protein